MTTKSFRIYRANKNNNGCASEWQLSYKEGEKNKFEPWLMFLTVAPQTGVNENGDASFDWKEKAITIKLGPNDIGELMATLEGRQDQLGYNGKGLYHESPNGGNKSLQLAITDNGFNFQASAQDKEKKLTKYYHSISRGEASMLLVLLKKATERIFNW